MDLLAVYVLVIMPSLTVYWLPAIIAVARRVPAKAQVVIVNLFLGWTVVGWVVALVMAFRVVPPAPAAVSR
jgi:hypothetical protein